MSLDIIAALCVYFVMGVQIYYIPDYTQVRMIFIAILALYIFSHFKILFRKDSISVKICAILFSLLIIVSAVKNRSVSGSIIAGVGYAVEILITLFATYIIYYRKKALVTVKPLFFTMVVLNLLNDVIAIVAPSLFVSHLNNYFIGNKFETAYSHLLMFVFYYLCKNYWIIRYNRNLYIKLRKRHQVPVDLFILWLWTFMSCLLTGCYTGVVGCLLIALFSFAHDFWNRLFINPLFYLGSIAVFDSVLLINAQILQIPLIKNIIINVFHSDPTLQTRTIIYASIMKVVNRSPVWGFGYGNSYRVLNKLTGWFPNAQNGILQNVINFGIAGVAAMLCFEISVLLNNKDNRAFPMLSMLYVYIVISSVEITFERGFIFALLFYFGLSRAVDHKRYRKYKKVSNEK